MRQKHYQFDITIRWRLANGEEHAYKTRHGLYAPSVKAANDRVTHHMHGLPAYRDRASQGIWVEAEAVPSKRENPDSDFGEVISSYSRKQALEDGDLVDMTEWGSNSKGFHGGFTTPVAITRALWSDIDRKPLPHLQDVRGRAHDVLWMASLAVRGGLKRGMISDSKRGGRVGFYVLMQVGRKRKHFLNVDLGPGDSGEPVVTIGYPSDF